MFVEETIIRVTVVAHTTFCIGFCQLTLLHHQFGTFPVSRCSNSRNSVQLVQEELDEVGRQVSNWLNRLRTEGAAALRELRNWDKVKIRETLDWIQSRIPPRERRANLIAV